MPKMLEQLLDGEGNAITISGGLVVDKASGQSFAHHAGDTGSHVPEGAINDKIAAAVNLLMDNASGDTLPTNRDSLKKLADALSSLETTLNAFLVGDDDGGALDRLKELVAAIEANKGSIDAIVAGYLKKADVYDGLDSNDAEKVLTARQGKVLNDALSVVDGKAHVHANAELLAALSTAANGNLVCNGHELSGGGIAVMGSPEDTPVFNGRLRMLITEYTT